ncbi:UNVERIFIED_CONTAM: ABC transporter permease [Kocuria sp. CPCC 205295]|uniref:hypothetical protein n=1 Tax=Kocuria sp. CPCC 205295 TaxID=3073557 RepID=UPI0036D84BAA
MSSPSLEVHGQLSAKPVTPWPKVLITALMSAVITSIIVLAFSWPTVTSVPKSIPLMIAGPEQQAEMVQDQLEDAQPDLFDVTTGDDRDAAVEAIEHRDVYGAVVIGQPVEVISASANNAATGQILHRAGEQLGQKSGMPGTQTDLIPFSENDPNGAGLGVLSFPMVMGGLAGGIVIGLQVVGGGRKIVAVLVYGVLAGFAVTALGRPLLDIFQREFELTWLAVGLAFAAMSATVAGLVTLLRTPGIPMAAVLFMFFASPISGTNTPKEFLPGPWGEIGQFLPPGAISTLIRDISYFPEADTTMQWPVLSGWLALGHRADRHRAGLRATGGAPLGRLQGGRPGHVDRLLVGLCTGRRSERTARSPLTRPFTTAAALLDERGGRRRLRRCSPAASRAGTRRRGPRRSAPSPAPSAGRPPRRWSARAGPAAAPR